MLTADTYDALGETLSGSMRGELIDRGHPAYDEARTVWNAMIDKRPAFIACCRGVADVIEAVDFARQHSLAVSVRGGGHNISGASVCDDGLVIDLSAMRSVRVDPVSRTARVGAGATWADVDHETQKFGLAVPSGVVSTTGVAGLTLGGGLGRLSRKHGLTADNLISADVVTADGRLLTATSTQNSDLFWGIRGGGGNFGIVTSFVFALHNVGPEVLFGPVVYRLDDAAEVLANYREFAVSAPGECCVWVDFLTAPALPFLPEDAHGTKVVFVAPFYTGDIETGEELLKPLRTFGEPLADAVAVTPYKTAQSALDELYSAGARNYWKSHNFTRLPDTAIDTIVEFAETLPTAQSDILISHVGGAINDAAPNATAYPHRDTQFVITPGGRWTSPTPDDQPIAWVRSCYDALADHGSGSSYVNFIAEREGREHEAYGPNYERLIEIKNKYDPTNFFSHNQNISPTV